MKMRGTLAAVFSGLALLASGPVLAASPAGIWALHVDGINVYRFEISQTETGWRAIWTRPASLGTPDGYAFLGKGPLISRVASKVVSTGDSLELTFDDPKPGNFPDVFRIQAVDETHATEVYMSANADPIVLVREATDAPLGPWVEGKMYAATIERPTNTEMTAIFNADQAIRQNWTAHDTSTIIDSDRQRRERTSELIRTGALHSGEDFYHAAFVFQHGETPDDFLLGHVLAMVAMARGNSQAAWIAAATLDRYLIRTKQSQIFGTQTRTSPDAKPTQEPYDRNLIPDALRAVMNVPSLAQQTQALKQKGGDDTPAAKP